MTGERASDTRPPIPRSTRQTLEHYAAEGALAKEARKKKSTWPPTPTRQAHQTDIVYWVGTDEGRLGAFGSYEEACEAAGPCAVGWSEISRARARQLLTLGADVRW